ncbi:hypothetical protein NQ318_023380 [Aromia moschata]|uniref:Uncharacterized protein n=1 Tax=Aromia moschata TaxID=1265417 RepID=A0AAV8X1I0_9CUCU|nr:hypothetical protein NQ318_023380 [Aromia moschata]
MSLSLTINSSRMHICRLIKTPRISNFRQVYPFLTKSIYQVREAHRKSIYKTEEAKKIRFYVLTKYMEYLKNYDKVLERSFPGAMRVYRVFADGIRDFMKDTKEYFMIIKILYTPGPGSKFDRLLRRK